MFGSQSCAAFVVDIPLFHYIVDALLLKCPLHQLQLQKIVGFRPPLEYLSERNLIYAPPIVSNFKDRDRRSGDYGLGERTPDEQPASQLCWRSCNEDPDCIAYVHLLDTDECYGYSYFERSSRYLPIGHDLPLVADGEAMFYEKTCLRGTYCCHLDGLYSHALLLQCPRHAKAAAGRSPKFQGTVWCSMAKRPFRRWSRAVSAPRDVSLKRNSNASPPRSPHRIGTIVSGN